jgi:hypothetical protein
MELVLEEGSEGDVWAADVNPTATSRNIGAMTTIDR